MSDLLRLASLLEESLFKMFKCISRSVGSHIYGPRYDSIKNVCLETCQGPCSFLHGGGVLVVFFSQFYTYIRDNFFTRILIYLLPGISIYSLEHLEHLC